MRREALPAMALALLVLGPGTARALEAPGRVAYGIDERAPVNNVDAGGASAAVALPDGGVVAAGGKYGELVMSALTPSGALDRRFGRNGVARPDLPVEQFTALQVLRQPDGGLRIVGTALAGGIASSPRMAVLGLRADGTVDRAYGTDGLADSGIETACGPCSPGAFAPDGALLLAGARSPRSVEQPNRSWVVARLDGDGKRVTGFGEAGLATVPGDPNRPRGGFAVGTGPDGRIVTFGIAGDRMELTALTASGAVDASYNGGAPVRPTFGESALIRRDGSVDLVGSERLQRILPDGRPDIRFGSGGIIKTLSDLPGGITPLLLEQPDGGVVVVAPAPRAVRQNSDPDLRVLRFGPDGHASSPAPVKVGIAGGVASFRGSNRGNTVQRSFVPSALLERPGGGVLLVGGARIAQPLPDYGGQSARFVAVAALGADLQTDRSYGGKAEAPRVRLTVPAQSARTDQRLDRVLVRARASTPGLLLVRVRDGRGRVLAQQVAPVYAAGPVTVRVPLTATGHRVLRRGAAGLRVRVSHDLRGLLDGRTRGVSAGRLR